MRYTQHVVVLRRIVALVVLLLLMVSPTANGWETVLTVPQVGDAPFVEVDAAGDIIAAGEIEGEHGQVLTVVKLNGQDGHEVWRYVDEGSHVILGMALRGNDPIVAGADGSNASAGVVLRLSSQTGNEAWRSDGPGGPGGTVVVDSLEDVVVTGLGVNGGSLMVMKKSGADGAEIWRRTLPRAYSTGVAVDSGGDVLVAATPLVRLAGGNGDVMWTQAVLDDNVAGVLLSTSGDVVVGGFRYRSKPVFRLFGLAGRTGKLRWRTSLTRSLVIPLWVTPAGRVVVRTDHRDDSHPSVAQFRSTLVELSTATGHRRRGWRVGAPLGTGVEGMTSDDAGDLIIIVGGGGRFIAVDSLVSKVRGKDGRRIWQQPFSGANHPNGFVVEGLTVDAHGDVVVSGYSTPTFQFAVAKLSGTTGAE